MTDINISVDPTTVVAIAAGVAAKVVAEPLIEFIKRLHDARRITDEELEQVREFSRTSTGRASEAVLERLRDGKELIAMFSVRS